jgi:hypothetical protein
MEPREWQAIVEILQRPEQPREGLEARVQLLEDRERIRDIIMQYGYYCDAQRYDELFALYVDDVERELSGTLVEKVRGKAALGQLMRSPVLAWKSGSGGPPPPEVIRSYEGRHLITGEVIRVSDDGSEAWATAQYSLVKVSGEDPTQVRRGQHEGSYVFSFRKIAGDWKFTRLWVITNNAHNPLYQRSSEA